MLYTDFSTKLLKMEDVEVKEIENGTDKIKILLQDASPQHLTKSHLKLRREVLL